MPAHGDVGEEEGAAVRKRARKTETISLDT